MGALTVRPARVEDGDAVARVHVAGWRWAYPGIVDAEILAGLDPALSFWQRWLAEGSPDGTLLVAVRDGEIVGFVNHGRSRDPDADAGTGQIRAIYVDPAVQGTGVGAALMNRAVAELSTRYREATLWVLEENALGRRFYALGGWQPDGATREEPNGASPPLAEIRLRRPLP